MIWLIVFLLFTVTFVALAYHFGHVPRQAALGDLDALCGSEIDRYAHVRRVLAPEDFHFLAGSRRGAPLVPRFRQQRLRVLSQYVGQMREEFYSLVAIGSLFAAAPTGQSERLAERIALARVRFELLALRTRLLITLNSLLPLPLNVSPLLQAIGSLRTQADRTLHRLTPQDLAALRTALRVG